MNADETYSRYPLQWPVGWRRTPADRRKHANFSKRVDRGGWRSNQPLSVHDALTRVSDELRRFGIRPDNWVISSNVPTRLDGMPSGSAGEPADPGVAVYFRLRSGGRPKVFACDRWLRVADNLAAIAGHIAALRAVERYGVGETEQVLAGYTALPPSAEDWRSVFGFGPDETPSAEAVDARYRALIRDAHPDRGGDPLQAARFNMARDMAFQELRANVEEVHG